MARSKGQAPNCFTCQVRERTEWCVLTEREQELIETSKTARDYLPGDVIYHQGDPCEGVYCVESGLIGLRKLDADGNSVLVRLANAGDTIGYRSFLAGESHRLGAEALKASTVCYIPLATVRAFLQENPALGLRFLQRTANQLGETEEKFLQSTSLDIHARFAHLLLVLKDRFATGTNIGPVTFELPLSRQDMAAMIGVRPETMSRAIRKFEEAGLARFTGRTVNVPSVESLIDAVAIDA